MREFFRGWRRQVGCGLLLVAGFQCAAWHRSRIVTDIFDITVFRDHYYLQSSHGVVAWIRQLDCYHGSKMSYGHAAIQHTDPKYKYSKWDEPWRPDPLWRCRWQYGFGDAAIGSHEQVGLGRLRTMWCRVAFWECVLPLTLLSIYLLRRRS